MSVWSSLSFYIPSHSSVFRDRSVRRLINRHPKLDGHDYIFSSEDEENYYLRVRMEGDWAYDTLRGVLKDLDESFKVIRPVMEIRR